MCTFKLSKNLIHWPLIIAPFWRVRLSLNSFFCSSFCLSSGFCQMRWGKNEEFPNSSPILPPNSSPILCHSIVLLSPRTASIQTFFFHFLLFLLLLRWWPLSSVVACCPLALLTLLKASWPLIKFPLHIQQPKTSINPRGEDSDEREKSHKWSKSWPISVLRFSEWARIQRTGEWEGYPH